ncbi:hypothetical protein JJB09_04665 [Rhizobium sp. KVB221]|uniref:Uncharacterized protein n=1 Tax=Rhizobium setariae TaxID=2801340 RepID=A0A936YM81_9HYPH|nr:hypothetical protein [Rhizobium setariae]MBL0371312.1 hypothetical protein [Rhizobium setariae]
MKLLKILATLLAVIWCASCAIQSDTLLADPMGVGDPVEGFPKSGTFRLEVFDRDKNSYKPFATLVSQPRANGFSYILAFEDGTPGRLVLQAKTLSQGNYLIRFSQYQADRPATLETSALAFVTEKDATFYVLSAITTMDTLNEIFAGRTLPRGGDGADVWLDSIEQAELISKWFAKHYQRLADYKDYSQFRVVK